MKKLTAAEEQIMQTLWSLGEGGFMKDILEHLADTKPHYNTVGTLLKILVEKQFVGIKNPNRNNFYYPLVTKEEYSASGIKALTENYFQGSYTKVVSFLVDKKEMSIEDLEFLLSQLKKKGNDQPNDIAIHPEIHFHLRPAPGLLLDRFTQQKLQLL